VNSILVDGLARTYEGGFQALKGVSFAVPKGEFTAIMGPSGCGKSTLLNLLGLLDRPTGGKYLLEGAETARLDDTEITHLRRARIGFVFQAFNLLPRLSALENVALPMAYAGEGVAERRERASALLTRVGLGRKIDNTPLQLSGGERQRVGIARALANKPALLLADEPTGNLDSRSSAEILALFKELNAEGMTVVLVTHDPAIGAAAGRVIRIRDGALA
jgi:putative ABC transport system ATP-binding protein